MDQIKPEPGRLPVTRGVLEYVRDEALKEVAKDMSPKDKESFDKYIPLLIDAHFIREIPVSENGLPYRITWKGLSFLETYSLFDEQNVNANAKSPLSILLYAALLSYY